jgi:hypothetical protein
VVPSFLVVDHQVLLEDPIAVPLWFEVFSSFLGVRLSFVVSVDSVAADTAPGDADAEPAFPS